MSVQRIGNQKHYRANPNSPIFEELQSLVLKTVGLAAPLADALKAFGDKNQGGVCVWIGGQGQ